MFGFQGRKDQGYLGNLRDRGHQLYYHYDATGNVTDLTDHLGSTVLKYRYDAFGGVFTQLWNPYNQTGLTGKSYDIKASLMDYSARWYSPSIGRFTTQDTWLGDITQSQSLNRYIYVANNPVNFSDPTGHAPCYDNDNSVALCGYDPNPDNWQPAPGSSDLPSGGNPGGWTPPAPGEEGPTIEEILSQRKKSFWESAGDWGPEVVDSIIESHKSQLKTGNIWYDELNYWTLGIPDVVGRVFTSEPFSADHITASIELALAIIPAGKIKNVVDVADVVIDPKTKGAAEILTEGTGNGLKLRVGYDTHLVEVEDVVRKGNKGIVGGHNLDNFEKAFTDRGWSLDENIISKTPHPTISGVYEIKYQLPAVDKQGNIIPGQYKNIPNPKTVYDPSVISNEQMLQWGQEAMSHGTVNGRIITGTASNGLKFQGYIDNGEITNSFPTLK